MSTDGQRITHVSYNADPESRPRRYRSAICLGAAALAFIVAALWTQEAWAVGAAWIAGLLAAFTAAEFELTITRSDDDR
jgi:hypothetical protein